MTIQNTLFELVQNFFSIIHSIFKGDSFEKLEDFENQVKSRGETYGVIYKNHKCKTSDQYYMRCSFFRKKNPQGDSYKCGAYIYASISNGKLTLKKINEKHSHHLLTSEAIKLILSQSKESIPPKCQEEAYKFFINGESTKDIYDIIKKANFPNDDCPFGRDPLKNYLYNRNKKDLVKYNDLFEIYEKMKNERGLTKVLETKTFKNGNNLQGLSFTFSELIPYGMFFFLIKINF